MDVAKGGPDGEKNVFTGGLIGGVFERGGEGGSGGGRSIIAENCKVGVGIATCGGLNKERERFAKGRLEAYGFTIGENLEDINEGRY